jgi:hypothetical protein
MNSTNFLENQFTTMWIKDGILYVTYQPSLIVTEEVARICVQDRLKLCDGKSYPMLADGRTIKSFERNARSYLSKGDAIRGLTAGAFIIKNQIEKFMGNAFFTINKPKVPAKLFTSEEEALKWLQYFKHVN